MPPPALIRSKFLDVEGHHHWSPVVGSRHGTVRSISRFSIPVLSPPFVFLHHFPERGCMSVHLLGTIRFVLPKLTKLLILKGQAASEWYKSLTAAVFSRYITMSLFSRIFLGVSYDSTSKHSATHRLHVPSHPI